MRQSKRSTSVSRCHTYSTGWWSTWEMTWWKSMSLHVPGKITTPNRMHPPLPVRSSQSRLAANCRTNSTTRSTPAQADEVNLRADRRRPPPPRRCSPRSRGWPGASGTSRPVAGGPRAASVSSSVRSISLPTRMSRTSGKPSPSSARRMVVPCGSRIPGRSRTTMRAFMPPPILPGRARRAGTRRRRGAGTSRGRSTP